MRKFAKFAFLASALVIPQAASATPPSGILIGELNVSLHFSTTCDIVLNINGSSADITLYGGTLVSCNPYVEITSPVSITVSSNSVIFHDLILRIGSYSCMGDINASWNGMTLTIAPTFLPGPLSHSCYLDATAS